MRKLYTEQRKSARKMFFIENNQHVTASIEPNKSIMKCNPAANSLLGYSSDYCLSSHSSSTPSQHSALMDRQNNGSNADYASGRLIHDER